MKSRMTLFGDPLKHKRILLWNAFKQIELVNYLYLCTLFSSSVIQVAISELL